MTLEDAWKGEKHFSSCEYLRYIKPDKFEIGKFYEHTTGEQMSIICEAKTTMYGLALIAELAGKGGDCFTAVGHHDGATDNWYEISEERWMENFLHEYSNGATDIFNGVPLRAGGGS